MAEDFPSQPSLKEQVEQFAVFFGEDQGNSPIVLEHPTGRSFHIQFFKNPETGVYIMPVSIDQKDKSRKRSASLLDLVINIRPEDGDYRPEVFGRSPIDDHARKLPTDKAQILTADMLNSVSDVILSGSTPESIESLHETIARDLDGLLELIPLSSVS